ncbi:TonB-dependent receptor [Nitrospirillum viridazoti Y2]|uniref:Iron complex outermembrane receptor protein n=2 Tax=Nitrospirillum TaxID=1543705 RepID=A0A560IHL7_9PROT|nr:TonB-dependent receptor [Nitrospirillum amazonense]EGY02559.1 TonB-dependent receptor [Nitrospirillum amazonense Y2]TWB58533.1 iron complex outermembrane receptor protein [Nitrospirillum amazonense]
MSKMFLRGIFLIGACGCALNTAARAQSVPTADSDILQEVIVTAQHRAENVQDVPIAMSVVSGEALAQKGVTDFTSMQKLAPSLNITNDTNNTRVSVRGIGTLSNNEAQDQSIAVNIDGEYINRPTILNAAIFDVDRVEVLRGPQGTLYGRNTTGGAVNFITRKPGDTWGGNAAVTYGNYDQVIVEGGIDIPLGTVGGLRISGVHRSHDGYDEHTNTPFSPTSAYIPSSANRSDTDDTNAGRVTLVLKPVEGLTVQAAVERIVQDVIPASQAWADMTGAQNNPGTSTTTCGNGWVSAGTAGGSVACIPQNTHALSGINRHTYDSPLMGVGWLQQHSTAARGQIAYDFGPATVTYTGGYRTTSDTNVLTLAPAFLFTHYNETVETQSHELRFNGVWDGVLWQGGAFYFRELQATNGGLYTPFVGDKGSYVNYFQHPTDSRSWSGFGQVEVPLFDALTAVVGGRYTSDVRTATFANFNPFYYVFSGGTGAYNTGPTDLSGVASSIGASRLPLHYEGSKFTWLAGLNYKLDADTLIYGKVSTGFKAGGFDGTGNSFRPETNTAYEGGVKLTRGDNSQYTLDVAGFYYDYKDLQNDVLLNPAAGAQTFNAGKATIYGIEVEGKARLTRDDTISASVNWLHATYDKFLGSVSYYNESGTEAPTIDLSGNRLPQAPEWVLTLGYDHVFHLGTAGSLTASAYTRYKGDYYLDFYNYNDSHQVGHTETDLSVTYKPESKAYSVQLYVHNLEDYRSLAYAGNVVVPGQANIWNWQFGPPRTFGVRASADW